MQRYSEILTLQSFNPHFFTRIFIAKDHDETLNPSAAPEGQSLDPKIDV
jgi:hypothetical protein